MKRNTRAPRPRVRPWRRPGLRLWPRVGLRPYTCAYVCTKSTVVETIAHLNGSLVFFVCITVLLSLPYPWFVSVEPAYLSFQLALDSVGDMVHHGFA